MRVINPRTSSTSKSFSKKGLKSPRMLTNGSCTRFGKITLKRPPAIPKIGTSVFTDFIPSRASLYVPSPATITNSSTPFSAICLAVLMVSIRVFVLFWPITFTFLPLHTSSPISPGPTYISFTCGSRQSNACLVSCNTFSLPLPA